MSQAHLSQLRQALTQRGWVINERRRGDEDVEGATTWFLQRYDTGPILRIDFDGFGDMGQDILLEESNGCEVRGHHVRLSFFRVNRRRDLWIPALNEFVWSLDRIAKVEVSDGRN